MKQLFGLLFGLMIAFSSNAQLGGKSIFQFLNTPHNAKLGSIGNVNVSSKDNNVGMVVYNPALLNDEMANFAQFNEVFYMPGVKYSSLNYVGKTKKQKLWGAGINNLSYEKMDLRNEGGAKEGVFYANESLIYYTRANKINNFTLGYNLKFAKSLVERYVSMALLVDLGVSFSHPEKELHFGLVARNMGFLIESYTGNPEQLPFVIQSGFTFKPEHMPLKMSVTLNNLQQFDIVYLDHTQNSNGFFTDSTFTEPQASFGDKVFRHFTFGGELKLTKNIDARIGYNYMRRKELRAYTAGGAGFSFGFAVHIKDFDIEYGKTMYQFAGRPTFISISTNTNRFFKKNKGTGIPI